MRTLFCLLAFSVLLSGQKGDRPAPTLAAAKNKLAALLPNSPGFSGRPVGQPKFYSPADLYRYLDGGADAYAGYGLVQLVHREFKDGTVDLTVDIYDMGDPLRAFGIYSAERAPDYLFIPIGTEGYADLGSLDFLQGNYYVKLQAFGDNDKTPPVLESAARSIVSRIGEVGEVPQPVPWFPAGAQVAHSQKYIVKSPMGLDDLAPATTVLYRFGDKTTTVLASRASTPGEAVSRLAKLKQHFAGLGRVTALESLPGEVWRTSNESDGEMLFFARGSYVVVVQVPPADGGAFFQELYSSVKD